jgi:hypothetical protein
MKSFIVAVLMSSFVITAYAKKNCTDVPKESGSWLTEEDFKKKVTDMGYKIKRFKTPGTCYEIYGTDKDGNKVEIYFNPVDASIVAKD